MGEALVSACGAKTELVPSSTPSPYTLFRTHVRSIYTDPAWHAAVAKRVAATPGARVIILDAGARLYGNPEEQAGIQWVVERLRGAGVPYESMEVRAESRFS